MRGGLREIVNELIRSIKFLVVSFYFFDYYYTVTLISHLFGMNDGQFELNGTLYFEIDFSYL